jgi:hypothetical protein
MRKASSLILIAIASLTAHGQVFQGVKMAGVQVSTVAPAPLSGITFSPVAGHYTSAQSVSITSVPSTGLDMFYATDGAPVTEASPLYSSAFTLTANTTVNAMTISPPNSLGQNIQACSTGTCWKTQLACSSAQCSPYVGSYSTPGIAYGSGAGCNAGVCGIPTAIGFNTGIASPGRTGNATHLWFTTENISGAGSQTQVLWANKQAACDSCTYQVEDFYMYPAENPTAQWARESDLVNWVKSRNLILSAALQCYLGNGSNPRWQYNGQAGSWNEFGDTTSVYRNGTLVTTSPKINEGCTAALTGGVHVQYHATFVPNAKHCTDVTTHLATECVYIDYLAINGDVYTFGTQTVTDGSGNNVTVSSLSVPGAVLPSGYPSRCFNQLQIDTAGTGASVSNPITYGLYYDQVNMSCGGGVSNANGTAAYTIP